MHLMTSKLIYRDESSRGTNEYTFAVYEHDDGSYEVIAKAYRLFKNGTKQVEFEQKWAAATKLDLKGLNYKGSQRLAKVFLESEFFIEV